MMEIRCEFYYTGYCYGDVQHTREGALCEYHQWCCMRSRRKGKNDDDYNQEDDKPEATTYDMFERNDDE